MSRATNPPDSRIEIEEKDNQWGEYLQVVTDHMRHKFAIIDGTVLTGNIDDNEIRSAIKARGYEVA